MHFLETACSNAIAATLLAIVAFMATRMHAKEPLVHSLWVLVLVKLMTPALFAVPISWPVHSVESDVVSSGSSSPTTAHMSSSIPTDVGRDANENSATNTLVSSEQPARSGSAITSIRWSDVVTVIWLFGSVFCLLIIAVRALRFQRVLAHTELAPRVLRDRTRMLSQQIGLRRSPCVRITAGVVSPLVWCPLPFTQPTIVLPCRLLADLTDDEQATLLLHELAHLRRRDHWVRWLEVATAACFWWHPVAWIARRELQRTGDLCCDGWVLSCVPEHARHYANTLVQTIDFLAEAKPVLPPLASAFGQAEFLERRIQMILRRKLNRELSWPARVAVLVAAAVLPVSSRLVAEQDAAPKAPPAAADGDSTEAAPSATPSDSAAEDLKKDLPKSGVMEIVIQTDGKPIITKSLSRAVAKLEAIRKVEARRADSGSRLLVAINVNNTTREFTDSAEALRVVKGVSAVIDVVKKAKIQLGELGRLDVAPNQSQQSQGPDAKPTERRQQYRPTNAKDGADGFGIGGGLGGQGGGGYGPATQQKFLAAAASRPRSPEARKARIELLRQQLSKLLTPVQQSGSSSSSVVSKPAPKEYKLGKATLFSRMVHRDYQKATFSFEFELRDDPTYKYANDWDLQYGNGGDHFHVTMVSDDRSRIVDLGKIDWGQLDTTRLAKLPPNPQPRREFVPSSEGHIYLVHTVDRNSDLYALFRVEAIQRQQGTCDITWRLVDAPQ